MDIQQRARKILDGMTNEQKLAQVIGMFGGSMVPVEVLHRFTDGLGEISFVPGEATKEENYQRSLQEEEIVKGNCGIPAIRHNEALTGQMTADSTVFPSAIGLAATWNPELVQQMGDHIRRQMVAEGTRQALSPVMDVARDHRWGRMGETYGEDPTLCAAMSVAFVKGIQSDDLTQGVIATGKHFLGYGCSEGGLNMGSNPITPRELREVYAKPFQAAITEAKLGSIMNSYGSIDGELVIGSRHILTDLLRNEMGFEGMVVSDYTAIEKLVELKVCPDMAKAGLEALKAGLDCELPMPSGYTAKMLELLAQDAEAQQALDRAAQKMLEAKIKLGLLDAPAARKEWLESAYDRSEAEPLSLRAAHESIVLLKNDGILPLSVGNGKIALIGPHTDSIRLLFGGYTYPAAYERDTTGAMLEMPGMANLSKREPSPYQADFLPGSKVRGTSSYVEENLRSHYAGTTPTIAEALREKCPNAEIRCVKGCEYAGNDRSGIQEAVEVAQWADVVILVCGNKYGWGISSTIGEGTDSDHIGLPGVQNELAKQIATVGKPTVFVHMNARPISSEVICGACNAVLENWYPGDTGGKALMDVLFGDYNPAGRLPVTAARNAGQIPIHHAQRNGSGYRPGAMTIANYVDSTTEPLFYFGHGLSYTEFAYSNLSVTPEVNAAGMAEISCDVSNIGSRDGDEVVQVYVTDELASMLRPAEELAGFRRIHLKAGQTKRVRFTVHTDQFAFLNQKMEWIVEAGEMSVRVGASSRDIRLSGGFRITDTAAIDPKTRGFYAASAEELIE